MFHRSVLSAHRVALLATLVLPFAFSASAQQTTTLDRIAVESESDDILVQDGYVAREDRIGTKVDTPIADIPQAISVVTQDQIEDQKPRTLNEALSYTASANPNSFGFDSRYDAFFLRGFPAYYNGIFRDGLRQYNGPSAWFKTEPYGIEGLTVLKGPASSLYGVSGPGGIVNLVTKRPKEERFREVELLFGEHGRAQTAFDFSGPVNDEGTLLYRLTGLGRVSDTELPGYSDDKFYIAPALTWQPDGDTKLTILSELSRAVTGATAIFYNDKNVVTDIFMGDPAWNDFTGTQGRIGYEFEHRVNDVLTVRQNLRFSAVDADMKYSAYTPSARSWHRYKEEMQSFVVDNMAQFNFFTGAIEHALVAGVDYSISEYDAYGPVPETSLSGIKIAPVDFSGSQETSQFGVYIHDQMRWNNFTLFASGRYDWVDTTSVIPSVGEIEQKDDAFSGRIGVSYRTEWGIIPYANYSTSFSPNIGFVKEGSSRRPASPTIAQQKEIGVKYEVPGTNAVLSAAFFDIDQQDGSVFDASGGGATQIQRQYDMNSRGIELEANASFDNGFSFIASYTHLRVKIEDGPADTIGKELSATPNDIFSLWGHYAFQSGSLEGLGLGAGVRYIGESYGNDSNTIPGESRPFVNDDRYFIDAALSYDFGAKNTDLEGLSLQVNAKNLLDERGQMCSAGYCYRDEGRSVFGSLRYRF